MSLTKAASKLYAANVIRSILGFLGMIFFARMLGAAELGFYFLFQALLGICSIPADFGINSALKKRVSEGTERNAYLSSAALLNLVSVTLVSSIILIFRGEINSYIGTPLAFFLVFGVAIQQYAQLMIHTLHGELRVGETASIELIEQIVWLSLSTILVFYKYGAVSLVYGLLAAQGVKFLIALKRTETQFGFPRTKHFASVFDYSKYSVISSIGGYAYSWLDILIIGFFLTSSHVGAYEVAWRVSGFVLVFSKSVGMTVFPQISEWSIENAQQKIGALIPKATIATTIVSVPAFFGTLLFSSEILEIFFGQEYILASAALIILMFEKILQSIHKIWGYSLQAINRPDQAAAATITSLLVNIVLNIVLVPTFGLTGAACATAVSFALNTGLHAYYLSQSISLVIEYHKIIWCIVASVGMTVVLYSLQGIVPASSVLLLLSLIAAGVITYFTLIFLYMPLRTDIISVFDTILPHTETS